MTVSPRTAAQFITDLQTALASRTTSYDYTTGPIYDTWVYPPGVVMEAMQNRLREVSLILSLENVDQFARTDVEPIFYNEGVVLSDGGQATGTLVCFRNTLPSADIVIPIGFPVATVVDGSTGASVTFYTTETRTMLAASGPSYFNPSTGRYEISVAIKAVGGGSRGNVAAGRVSRNLRTLPTGLDGITTTANTTNGTDTETIASGTTRYFLSQIGRQLGTPRGLERWLRDNFTAAQTVFVAYGSSSLITRAATDAGAVDVFIKERTLSTVIETGIYLGTGYTHPVAQPPLVSVESVSVNGTPYAASGNWEMVSDTSGLSGSSRAAEGVRFLSTFAGGPVGSVLSVSYTSNSLVRSVQAAFPGEEVAVFGADPLARQGTQVSIYLTTRLKVRSGFSYTTVAAAARAAVLAFITDLSIGDAVEMSDLQGVVRALTGVDNFLIDRLVRDAAASGAADLTMTPPEYADLADVNFLMTAI